MFAIIALVFALVWAFGIISNFTFGGLVHLLLLPGLVFLAMRIRGKKTSKWHWLSPRQFGGSKSYLLYSKIRR